MVKEAVGEAAGEAVGRLRMGLSWMRDGHIQEIAYICGFGDAGAMRRAFVRTLGITPADYRKRFRTTTASRSVG